MDRLACALRLAYSGELAAALAYRGHARSVRNADERARLEEIGREELEHRTRIGEMLAALGRQPDAARERRASFVGRALSLLCHVAGWYLPMYAAGALESRNVREYVDAARLAEEEGHGEFADDLLSMAVTEFEHERFFRDRASSHWLWTVSPKWPAPLSVARPATARLR